MPYLPEHVRFLHLPGLTEGANLCDSIANAVALAEEHNTEAKGVLVPLGN